MRSAGELVEQEGASGRIERIVALLGQRKRARGKFLRRDNPRS